MKSKIHVEKPCHEDWDKMTPQKEGRLCAMCQTTVVDFSNKTLDEIKAYFETPREKKVCGVYLPMHTTEKNKWFDVLNWIERGFSKVKLQRVAVPLIAVLLILTGCRTRRTKGVPAYYKDNEVHNRHN